MATVLGCGFIDTSMGELKIESLVMEGNIDLGAHLLKTTNLAIKEGDTNTIHIRNAADSAAKNLLAAALYGDDLFGDELYEKTGAAGVTFKNILKAGANLEIGAYLLKTTNLALKELDANTIVVRNAADDADKDLKASTLKPSSVLALAAALASRTITPETLGVGVTTFAVTGEAMQITGDGGANTIATITGGTAGQILVLTFVDALVTITDTDAHDANTVDLNAAFTSADDTMLVLFFDGTSWYELMRSVN